MANETHNGDLNKSKGPGPSKGEGTYGSKTSDPEATLRKGNMPKPEAVRDAQEVKGAAVKAAQNQNTSDGKDWPKGRNVIPNKGDDSVCGCCSECGDCDCPSCDK